MAETLTVHIDGDAIVVPVGTMVAAAVLNHGSAAFRRSVAGAPRLPLCGMGICFECRVEIDGRPGERSCTVPCRDGMRIRTADSAAPNEPTEPNEPTVEAGS